MYYSKPKNWSRWPDQSANGKSGIACISGDEAVYSIHKHLDLSHMTDSIRNNEDEVSHLQEEIKEPICSNEGEGNDAVLLGDVPEEEDPLEQEIESLKNQVFDLQQSKQELERQLLLYNGLKEQDSVRLNELQRVMEAKTTRIEILDKKIESLEGENRRLEVLAAERAMLKTEMESARMKMKETRSKIRKSWGNKKEIMAKLLQQMAGQRAREAEMKRREAEMKMIIEGLHGEIEELKKTNMELLSTKNELTKQMDSIIQTIATEREAAEKAIEEAHRLKIANEKLSNGLKEQLLLYNGLKEQDSVKLNELQRVMEAKTTRIEILDKKIESLEGENRRLEVFAAETTMLKTEMESAWMKIKETRSKIRKSWGNKKEIMAKLLQQMAAQRAREAEMKRREAEMKMIIEGFHGEIEEVKKTNMELLSTKNELTKQMDSIIQVIATEREAAEKAIEEAHRLKIANDKLSKQIEMYRNDRRTDLEELIYLRWINACMKYELQKRHNSKDQKSPIIKHEKGEKIVVELGLDEKYAGYDSDCSSTSTTTETFGSTVIDDGTERGPKKSRPKLLSKIKGWVKNNDGSTKKVQDEEDKYSNSADVKVKVRNSRPCNLLFYCGELDCATEMKVIPRSANLPMKTTTLF